MAPRRFHLPPGRPDALRTALVEIDRLTPRRHGTPRTCNRTPSSEPPPRGTRSRPSARAQARRWPRAALGTGPSPDPRAPRVAPPGAPSARRARRPPGARVPGRSPSPAGSDVGSRGRTRTRRWCRPRRLASAIDEAAAAICVAFARARRFMAPTFRSRVSSSAPRRARRPARAVGPPLRVWLRPPWPRLATARTPPA